MTARQAAPPPEIPGFRYVDVLGSGGFSDVYLYEQDRPRRRVAIKVQLADLRTDDDRAAFEREADLMAQVSTHPYIVTIYEADVTAAGHSYLAMEYCSRPSLNVRARQERLDVGEVLAIGVQVASAVETAHRAGIVHRDIKPANILVTDYNRPALTDFGISGTMEATEAAETGMSIPWSPPEAFDGGATDGVRLDVWSLAATLHTLLTGRSPFAVPGGDNSQAAVISRIAHTALPRIGRQDVPDSLEQVLATAMAKNPSARYPTAAAFALDLQRIQAELGLSVTPFEVLAEPTPARPASGPTSGLGPDPASGPPVDGGEATRVRGVVSIDPDGTTNARTGDARFGGAATGAQTRGDHRDEVRHRADTAPPSGAAPAAGTVPVEDHTVVRPPRPGPVIGRVPGVAAGPAAVGSDRRRDPADGDHATAPDPGAGVSMDGSTEAAAQGRARRGRRGRTVALAVLAVAIVVAVAVVVVSVLNGPTPTPEASSAPALSETPSDPLIYGTVPTPVGLKGAAGNGGVVFTWRNPQPLQGDSYMIRPYTATDFSADPVRTAGTRAVIPRRSSGQTCLEVSIRRESGRGSETPARACWAP